MLKIAAVGVGGWGLCHVRNIFEEQNTMPAAFIDRNPEALLEIQKKYGVHADICFETVEDALKKVKFDAATVSVPNPYRVKILETLLRKNIHCLVDKPAVHTTDDLAFIKKILDNSRSILMIAQNYRFLDAAYKIKRLINSRDGGTITKINVEFCRRADFLKTGFYNKIHGPAVIALEMGSHHIDLMNYFIGAHPINIEGETWHEKNDLIQGHCHLKARLSYPGKIEVNYKSSLMGKQDITSWPGTWNIDCEKSYIIWDENAAERIKCFAFTKSSKMDAGSKVVNAKSYPEKSLLRCYEAFLKAITGKVSSDAAACMFKENAKVVLTGLAIHMSGEKGRAISLNQLINKTF